MSRGNRYIVNLCIGIALGAAACSGGGNDAGTDDGLTGFEQPTKGQIGAQVASYEPIVGKTQRFLVGLVAGEGKLVGYGAVQFAFSFQGTKDQPVKNPVVSQPVSATYRLVAGQSPSAETKGPRFITPADGLGVYGTDASFDRAGFWSVRVTAQVDGKARNADATFEVLPQSVNPFVGDPAPRTVNRLQGDKTVGPKAIDSRATPDGTVPDPELHRTTVADAIAAGRPVMLVISTPVYCISRFCGPITDSVQTLAQRFGDRMAFVHAEVWNDYEKRALNREAADWIFRPGAEPKEPWVFVVDRQGKIAQRFDNVATDAELEAAVKAALAA